MLTGFVKLEKGDYVVQNGANSAVSMVQSVSPNFQPELYIGWPGRYPSGVTSWL